MRSPRVLLIGLLALAGCAGNQAPLPVMPTIDNAIAMQAKLGAITDPPRFLKANIAAVMASCGTYFDQLVTNEQRNRLASGQVTSASQTLSAILGLAQVAPGPISVVGVVGPAIATGLANAQAGAPGGNDPAEMSGLILAKMNTYLSSIPPPTDPETAWLNLYGLYRTCSPSAIEATRKEALMDAPNHLVVLGAAEAALASAPSPQALAPRFAPPSRRLSTGIPLVMVHTPPPAAVAQAVPSAPIRKMRAEWLAIQRRGGRNAAEGGPRALPEIPHPVIDAPRTDVPAPTAAEVSPTAGAPLPPPPLPPPPVFQPGIPDRDFFGAR